MSASYANRNKDYHSADWSLPTGQSALVYAENWRLLLVFGSTKIAIAAMAAAAPARRAPAVGVAPPVAAGVNVLVVVVELPEVAVVVVKEVDTLVMDDVVEAVLEEVLEEVVVVDMLVLEEVDELDVLPESANVAVSIPAPVTT